ncbi:MAG: hypothetical protein ABR540_12550 [Acidimicrobiales bacterium]
MDDHPSVAGLTAAVVALVMDAVYISIISSENEGEWRAALGFGLLIGAGGLAAAVGSFFRPGPMRTTLLAAAAAVLLVVGVLGIFSIGFPLLVAGFLAAGGAVRSGAVGPCRWPRPGG